MLEKLFKLNENNTSIRTEMLAGLATFYQLMEQAWISAVYLLLQ
jgi:xanthine/uracil/vitamin C permease (AzgA family)